MDEDTKKCSCGNDCAGAATCSACGNDCPNTATAEEGASTGEEVEAPAEEEVL